MIFIYIILIFILIALSYVLFSSVVIYTKSNKVESYIKVKFLNKTLYDSQEKIKSPDKQEQVKEEKKEKITFDYIKGKIDYFLDMFSHIKGILKNARRKIKCDKFEFNLTFGLSDAFYVGMGTGVIWGAIGTVYPFINEGIDIRDPHISVNPKYNEECFYINYEGVYKIKICSILIILIKSRKSIKNIINIITKEKMEG